MTAMKRFIPVLLAALPLMAATPKPKAALFQGTATPAHKVVLTWTASADAASETLTYTVYRSTGACSGASNPVTLAGAGLLTATTFTDTAVAGGTSYCYEVVAVSASGAISAPSNEVTAGVPLAAPSGLAVQVQ